MVVLAVCGTAFAYSDGPWYLTTGPNSLYPFTQANVKYGTSTGTFYAGAFDMIARYGSQTAPATRIWTYCIDFTTVVSPDVYTRYVGEIAPDGVSPTVPSMTNAAWKDLAWLNQNYFTDSLTSNDKSAGFQLAVWNVIFDSSAPDYSLGTGAFSVNWATGNAQSVGQTYLNALAAAHTSGWQDYSANTVFYVDHQNQMGENVPEWPVAALVPFGLGVLAFGKRKLMLRK